AGPLNAAPNPHTPPRRFDQAPGDETRRPPPRPPPLKADRVSGRAGTPADTGPDHHTGTHLVVVGRRLPARIVERLARGAHGEDDEIVDLALFLRLHPLVGIETAVRAIAARNLTGDLRRQIGNV